MSHSHWTLQPSKLFTSGPVVPVIVISEPSQALPLAKALLAGGVKVMEVTLRTEHGLGAIEAIAKEFPEALIGAGTVVNTEQLAAVEKAGGMFAISPGATPALLAAGAKSNMSFIPGVTSPSEVMMGLEHGYSHFKFFPAEANGGVPALKALSAPFGDITICPTGGISMKNAKDYLALNFVHCIGGSWIVPMDLIEAGEWDKVTQLCKEAVSALS